MTNTRITDVEILERRYPVILNEFSIRDNSGGLGKYRGGNGVIRDMTFRKAMQASILSERRVVAPHGLEGGSDGERGVNIWVRHESNTMINMGGKNTVPIQPGDRIIIKTPGGGGCGSI